MLLLSERGVLVGLRLDGALVVGERVGVSDIGLAEGSFVGWSVVGEVVGSVVDGFGVGFIVVGRAVGKRDGYDVGLLVGI